MLTVLRLTAAGLAAVGLLACGADGDVEAGSGGHAGQSPAEPIEGPTPLPEDGAFLMPAPAAFHGGRFELVRFDDEDASFSVHTVDGHSLPAQTLASTNLVSVFDAQGTLLHSEIMTDQCPHWSGHFPNRQHIVPDQYPTIQAAVDNANYGDTVFVRPGSYNTTVRLRSGIRLVGAGAWQTQLTPAEPSLRTVDFSGAHDVVVRGFRFSNVMPGGKCASSDIFGCSGHWYSAAVYADGHDSELSDNLCHPTSALITQNVFDNNFIALLAYFHPRVVVRNNIFINNMHAVVMNAHQDHALILNNSFWGGGMAMGLDSSSTHAFNNIVSSAAIGIEQHFNRLGIGGCNLMHNAPVNSGLSATITSNADPHFVAPSLLDLSLGPGSPAFGAGCFSFDPSGSNADLGASGGLDGWDVAP